MENTSADSSGNSKLTRQDCIALDVGGANVAVENSRMNNSNDSRSRRRRASSGATSLTSNTTIINNNNNQQTSIDDPSNSMINNSNNNKSLITSMGDSQEMSSSLGSKFNHQTSREEMNPIEPSTSNEPLLGGFALLRAIQLLNLDIYYIGLGSRSSEAARLNRLGDVEGAAKVQQLAIGSDYHNSGQQYYRTFLDELASYNPIQKYIDKYHLLDSLCRFLKICLSLLAIMIGFDKTISTILLCLLTRIQFKDSNSQANTNSSMGMFVLILVNLSSMYILFSTIFNGHLLWNLLSQRLFLVSKRFQCKTILYLLIFIYLEYLINISFINNLYEWDFTSNNIQSGSYSVLANLRVLVTEQDVEHDYIDILLTIIQFARGIIRISPYIVINYSIICLKEHIHTIRNQQLLTDSLKKRLKLGLVVKRNRKGIEGNGKENENNINSLNRKKKVIFMTDAIELSSAAAASAAAAAATNGGYLQANNLTSSAFNNNNNNEEVAQGSRNDFRQDHRKFVGASRSISSLELDTSKLSSLNGATSSSYTATTPATSANKNNSNDLKRSSASSLNEKEMKKLFLSKIRDFDELESYITNLYIFTGRLNRLMSQQGLTVFFIVHNLVISVSVIMPETVRGGIYMAYIIRILVIIIGITPFCFGQSMNQQLEQLSRQIDRIIIQQQFIHRRRDNLVRIRELVHDIRVNCGGMLNFNVETGIKYLLLAFASAFFIEQEPKN